ncbi:MAG TPA: hypothetical protein VNT24_13785 [Propionibacteriaceae bacterium]|nr:hypothetical protein [Propionibacteriaceae bacterium]
MVDEASAVRPAGEEGLPQQRNRALLVNTSELIEGAVVVGALLVVISHAESDDTRVVLTALGVLAIYWLTHAYAHALSATLTHRRRLFGLLFKAIRHDSTILLGGVPALAVFAILLILGVEFSTAVVSGLWATILFLAGVGFYAGYRIGLRGWRLGVEALLAGSAGAFMLLLKTFLH